MRLDAKVQLSTLQNTEWHCFDSYAAKGRTYSIDRPISTTPDKRSNNCKVNHIKSSVTINDSDQLANVNYHFSRPLDILEMNTKTDLQLKVGQSYRTWVVIKGLDNNGARNFYGSGIISIEEPAAEAEKPTGSGGRRNAISFIILGVGMVFHIL